MNIEQLNNPKNLIKETILRNEKIEEKLNVIAVFSNVCNYKRRIQLVNEFIERMEKEKNVNLYVVELIYKNFNDGYKITRTDCKNHLQLIVDTPLWHKENMINLAVERLLPIDWKAFAWIDVDIEFENVHWSEDTLKVLSSYDIVQLFSHSLDLDPINYTRTMRDSFGYYYTKGYLITKNQLAQSHPGFAWAITRSGYEKIGKLIDYTIIGGGDNVIATSLLNQLQQFENYFKLSDSFSKKIIDYSNNVKQLKFGYVPGVIRHYFHGSKINRKYSDRFNILRKYKFDPDWLSYENGVIVPNEKFPKQLKNDILEYFKERNEDEYFF
jgi:hypothetical protein